MFFVHVEIAVAFSNLWCLAVALFDLSDMALGWLRCVSKVNTQCDFEHCSVAVVET